MIYRIKLKKFIMFILILDFMVQDREEAKIFLQEKKISIEIFDNV
jgi:hypothetical protein